MTLLNHKWLFGLNKVEVEVEVGDTQRTKVGCKSCEKNFTLNESLMYHIIEVHGKQ